MPPHDRWRSKFKIKEEVWVFVPTDETIAIGLHVKALIEDCWSAPEHYYHLKNGGHVRALQKHTKHKFFIHLDIKNFFGNINKSRITRSLKEYFPYEKARDIAVNSTVRLPEAAETKYILPFGFIQSPIIASVCLSKSALGRHLSRSSQRKDLSVSVYMDDILVSGNDLEELKQELKILEAKSKRSGLPLNIEKQEGPNACVTAFNVQLSQGLLQVIPSRLNEFANAYSNSENLHRRAGILNYVLSINPAQADAFRHMTFQAGC